MGGTIFEMNTAGWEQIRYVSTWDHIKQLLTKHKEDIEFLKQYKGLDNFLGSGEYGKVFKIKGHELTIKVTVDEEEIKVSKKLAGKKLESFIEVYYQKQVKKDLAIKIQQLLYPLKNKKFATAVDELHFNILPQKYPDPSKINPNIFEKFKDLKGVNYKDLQSFYLQFYKDYESLGLDMEFYDLDVHSDNVMQDSKGKIRVVDF